MRKVLKPWNATRPQVYAGQSRCLQGALQVFSQLLLQGKHFKTKSSLTNSSNPYKRIQKAYKNLLGPKVSIVPAQSRLCAVSTLVSPWAFLLCLAASLPWLFVAFPAISSRMQQSINLTATSVHVNSCFWLGTLSQRLHSQAPHSPPPSLQAKSSFKTLLILP